MGRKRELIYSILKRELIYSIFFINLINKKYNTDYRIEKNPKEYSDIDCYAISDSSKFNNFDLQLVSSDREIPRLSVENTRRFKKGEHMIASNVDYKTWILKAIEDKENSYTPKLIL